MLKIVVLLKYKSDMTKRGYIVKSFIYNRHMTGNIRDMWANNCETMEVLTKPGTASTGGLGTPPLVSGMADVVFWSLFG